MQFGPCAIVLVQLPMLPIYRYLTNVEWGQSRLTNMYSFPNIAQRSLQRSFHSTIIGPYVRN